MLDSLHHVGHLTDDYGSTLSFYRDVLGGTVTDRTTVDDAVSVAFAEWPGLRIEVVCRDERGTYLDDLLDALREESPYHLAVTVPDIERAMASMEDQGYRPFDPDPVEGLGPYVRAFVTPEDTPGLPLELVELDDAKSSSGDGR